MIVIVGHIAVIVWHSSSLELYWISEVHVNLQSKELSSIICTFVCFARCKCLEKKILKPCDSSTNIDHLKSRCGLAKACTSREKAAYSTRPPEYSQLSLWPIRVCKSFYTKGQDIVSRTLSNKSGWDDAMPSELKEPWSWWLHDLPLIQNFAIPCCLKSKCFETVSAELHHFADASERAYGAVSYLCMVDNSGNSHCSFLMSKSRLAPLKPTTIPRLELAAAVEAVKINKLLQKELEVPLQESVYWSDSMIVLWYLQRTTSGIRLTSQTE